jgi:hypothetical protein
VAFEDVLVEELAVLLFCTMLLVVVAVTFFIALVVLEL